MNRAGNGYRVKLLNGWKNGKYANLLIN